MNATNYGNLVYGSCSPSLNDNELIQWKSTWITAQYQNVFIGYDAGLNGDSGNCNIFIGKYAGFYNYDYSNHFNGYKKRAERLEKLKTIFNDEL